MYVYIFVDLFICTSLAISLSALALDFDLCSVCRVSGCCSGYFCSVSEQRCLVLIECNIRNHYRHENKDFKLVCSGGSLKIESKLLCIWEMSRVCLVCVFRLWFLSVYVTGVCVNRNI